MNLSEHYKEKIDAMIPNEGGMAVYMQGQSFRSGAEYVLDSITPDVACKFAEFIIENGWNYPIKDNKWYRKLVINGQEFVTTQSLFSYWITNIFKL